MTEKKTGTLSCQNHFFNSVTGAALVGSVTLTVLIMLAMELTAALVIGAK